uniref:Cyclin-dependent kinases regulatory subunit n=1 Tax=Cyprinus carpio TaxID=7962 RepID=A0A8C1I495_CYPCA
MSHKQIFYSDKYDDDKFEYRHVMLPKDIAKRVPKTHLMSETEWRNLGVQQSQGWVHYMIHQPGMCVFARMSKTRPNMCHLYCCHC